jgi:hypothetical protein
MKRIRNLPLILFGVPALLFASLCAAPAHADVAACYRLAYQVKASDVKMAYTFVTDHPTCLAHFDDPAFLGVAGALTLAMQEHVITPQTCSTVLQQTNSPLVAQLENATGGNLDVVNSYLDCGCAVAESGIGDRLAEIVKDIGSCAAAFDPSEDIEKGLDVAGTALGFSTLWGLESNASDSRAGIGNGGAPTVSFVNESACPIGVQVQGSGTPGQVGGFATCYCPAPTALYSNEILEAPDAQLAGAYFECRAPCPAGQAVQGGMCKACTAQGPHTTSEPDPSQTKCVVTGTGFSCPAGQEYVNSTGTCMAMCAADQKRNSATAQCQTACVPPHVWDPQAKACVTVAASCPPPSYFSHGICVNPCTVGSKDPACAAGPQPSSEGDGYVPGMPLQPVAPSSVCPQGMKWNGLRCVKPGPRMLCPAGQRLENGKCVMVVQPMDPVVR